MPGCGVYPATSPILVVIVGPVRPLDSRRISRSRHRLSAHSRWSTALSRYGRRLRRWIGRCLFGRPRLPYSSTLLVLHGAVTLCSTQTFRQSAINLCGPAPRSARSWTASAPAGADVPTHDWQLLRFGKDAGLGLRLLNPACPTDERRGPCG
jgi:hypothetical protein